MDQDQLLTDLQWQRIETLFPKPEKRGRGKPHTPWRSVVNTVLFVTKTNCKWSQVPQGPEWASKSAAHRYFKLWKETGLLNTVHSLI
jgi:transposase